MSGRRERVRRHAITRARRRAVRELERWAFATGNAAVDTTTAFFGFGALELRVRAPFDHSQGVAVRELRDAARESIAADELSARAAQLALIWFLFEGSTSTSAEVRS